MDPYDSMPLFGAPETEEVLGRQLLREKGVSARVRAAALLGARGASAKRELPALVYALRVDPSPLVTAAVARALWTLAHAGVPGILEELNANLYRGSERTALVAHVLEHAEAAVGRIA